MTGAAAKAIAGDDTPRGLVWVSDQAPGIRRLRVGDDFAYVDEDGEVRGVGSGEVNDYIRDAGGADFTAKDFRTWHGTVHALALWIEHGGAPDEPRPSAKELLGEVAKRLGNTVAVCRKSYVHPRVLAALGSEVKAELMEALGKATRRAGLTAGERRLLAFLSRA